MTQLLKTGIMFFELGVRVWNHTKSHVSKTWVSIMPPSTVPSLPDLVR